jgi:3-phosphoshikimate 1-carboxyvinyltransferase
LGAGITEQDGICYVLGTAGNINPPENIIDVGNPGTTLYLALSLAAISKGWSIFTGDHQIRYRSAENLLQSLKDFGATAISSRDNGCAPIMIKGPLKGGKTSIECPASQYLSSLLLSLPLAENSPMIKVPLLNEKPYVDITL